MSNPCSQLVTLWFLSWTQLLWGWCHERTIFKDFYKIFICWCYSLKLIAHVFTLHIMLAITNVNKLRQPDANPSPHHRSLEMTLWGWTANLTRLKMRLNRWTDEFLKWEFKDDESQNHTLSVMHWCWHNCANIWAWLKHTQMNLVIDCVTTNCSDLLVGNLTVSEQPWWN